MNCDAALEPGAFDTTLIRGWVAPKERVLVMRSPVAGRWFTPVDVGTRVYKRFTLGQLGSIQITAPVDGILRGIARDDTDVPRGAELIEISTTGAGGRWWGLDERGVRAAKEIGACCRISARVSVHRRRPSCAWSIRAKPVCSGTSRISDLEPETVGSKPIGAVLSKPSVPR